LGGYQIVSPLGRGGMGEVYRARDTTLLREVALKLVAPELAADATVRERLTREARLLAALNHPNIGAIYSFDSAADRHFLVLELIDGTTLAETLRRAPPRLRTALEICLQIAAALEAAHEQHIIHRDLKPSNVMVDQTGRVKVLDFGIARTLRPEGASLMAESLTTSTLEYAPFAGTVPYMSPEQLRGERADTRSDIWSFGCVLYEAVTGSSPFGRATISDTIAAVLDDEPDWGRLPPNTPAQARSLIRRCLRKEAALRLRDIGDARIELADMLETPREPTVSERRLRHRQRWLPAVAVLIPTLVAAVLGAAYLLDGRRRAADSAAVVSVAPPFGTNLQWAVVSPDGEQILLVAAEPGGPAVLWLRSLQSARPRRLDGTAGALYPFWSPDGRAIGFFADGRLKRVDAAGGAVESIREVAGPRGATWNAQGTIVFASTAVSGLWTVSASGGSPRPLTTLDAAAGENSHRWPSFLPDGRHVLYFTRNPVRQDLTGVYVVSLETHEVRQLLQTNSSAVYAPPGYLMFRRGENLLAQPFDPASATLAGDPVTIVDDVWYEPSFSGLVNVSVSNRGRLVYRSGGIAKTELLWLDRQGQVVSRVGDPGNYLNLYLAPEDEHVAVSRTDEHSENRELFVVDLGTGAARQLTFHGASDFSPVWSPDGSRLIFSSDRGGSFDLYEQDAAGVSEPSLRLQSPATKLVTDWSRNGLVVFTNLTAETRGVWMMRPGETTAAPLRDTAADESFGVLSPDSRLVAYTSNETGQYEVFVESLARRGRWKVSTGGGFEPVWHPGGTELFYLAPDGQLYAVDTRMTGEALAAASPRRLFATRVNLATLNPPDSLNHYDVSADGERFLISSTPAAPSAPVSVIFNWSARLK
jgi:Tol biopolymer transport system component